ncbi:alpha/beta hydrolase [Bacillus sp. P14.5]|nr:alpha/beta hydrolase [Bacillus sp. P14.5]
MKIMTYHYPSVSKEDIQSLSVPILILNGINEKHELEAAYYIKETNEAALVELVPGAGHTANIDRPDTFNKLLENFLR